MNKVIKMSVFGKEMTFEFDEAEDGTMNVLVKGLPLPEVLMEIEKLERYKYNHDASDALSACIPDENLPEEIKITRITLIFLINYIELLTEKDPMADTFYHLVISALDINSMSELVEKLEKGLIQFREKNPNTFKLLLKLLQTNLFVRLQTASMLTQKTQPKN